LKNQSNTVTIDNLFDPSNVELALYLLPEEAWKSVDKPTILQRDDGTYVTGDPFFDELEEALSQGENLDGILKRLKLSTEQ
jgi:hypothetical protein